MNEFESRREKLFASLPDYSLALIYAGQAKICSEDEFYPFEANRNFFYLTGIEQENSVLMLVKVPGEKRTYLFLDEYNEVKERWTGKKLRYDDAKAVSGVDNVYSNNTFQSMLEMSLEKEDNPYGHIDTLYLDLSDELKIGLNQSTQVLKAQLQEKYPELKFENIYQSIVELRLVKSPYEIAQLEEAINATSTGINDILAFMRPGYYEHELADRFEYYGKSHGRRKLAFETIIATGIDGTVMHHPIAQQTRQIDSKDLILFDLGYKHNGYCADISRTFPVNGVFSGKQKEIYEIVLACNKAVINYIKPGLTIVDLQNYTLEFLKTQCLAKKLISNDEDIVKYYIHNVSHFLGLDTHDVGVKTRKLVPGNVITVEPGLYFVEDGIGVRIEDDVLVTEEGSRCLSKCIKKEVEDVEKLLRSRS